MKNEKLKIKNGKGPRITRITTNWFYFFNHRLRSTKSPLTLIILLSSFLLFVDKFIEIYRILC